MPRNKDFSSHNLIRHHHLRHETSSIQGPIPFLNPTSAHFHDEHAKPDHEKPQVAYKWTSRNNRKGRHELAITPSLDASPVPTPAKTRSTSRILKTVWLMIAYYPYWDVSWWVAYIFTWGSIVWVFNAFFVFLPYIQPSTDFANETLYGGGITAFIGASIFEVGSVLLMIEAVNENRADCFGWEVKHALSGHDTEKGEGLVITEKECTHHHANRHNLVGKGPKGHSAGVKSSNESESSRDAETKEEREVEEKRRAWIWWPTIAELKGHYLRELGFLACSSQMVGATVFWIAGFTALPGIFNKLSPAGVIYAYWNPQVAGGFGFVISGLLFMIETQKKWYIPALKVLGWHIGFWNFIGGVGFFLSPVFGYYDGWGQYQAGCATFWASWAFLIGSVIQLYESLEKRPVSIEKIGEAS